MELGTVLKVVRDQLRLKFSWKKAHCRVVPNGEPLERSPEFFVGLCDGGIEGGIEDGYFEYEKFRIEVWVWRRLGQYSKDRHGNAMLDEDPHLANIQLPSGLERRVKKFIHMNYALMNAINTEFGTGTSDAGSGLQHPFVYQGSSRTQVQNANDGGTSVASFAGRQLRFSGGLHVDPIDEDS